MIALNARRGGRSGLIGRAAPSVAVGHAYKPVRFVLGMLLALMGAVVLAGTLHVAWGSWFASAMGTDGG